MSHRCLAAVFTVIGVVTLTPMFAAAQSAEPPRTPDERPDLRSASRTIRRRTPGSGVGYFGSVRLRRAWRTWRQA